MHPRAGRELAWQRLAADLDSAKLAEMTNEIGLGEVIDAGREIMEGQVRGRLVVRVA